MNLLLSCYFPDVRRIIIEIFVNNITVTASDQQLREWLLLTYKIHTYLIGKFSKSEDDS